MKLQSATNMARTTVLALVALAGCATPPAEPTPAERAAADKTFACYGTAAAELDDGVSDARSVGKSVQSACWRESQTWVAIAIDGTWGAYQAGTIAGLDQVMQERAATAVLRVRAARRKQ